MFVLWQLFIGSNYHHIIIPMVGESKIILKWNFEGQQYFNKTIYWFRYPNGHFTTFLVTNDKLGLTISYLLGDEATRSS